MDNTRREHTAVSKEVYQSRSVSRIFRRRGGNEPATTSSATIPVADAEVSLLREATFDTSTPAALRVAHLRKSFGHGCVAVSDSSFVMQRGELLGIIGANGSGKSTTCHLLCGMSPVTAGEVLIDDHLSLLARSPGGSLIGWCPQEDILFDDLTPMEHVNPL